MGTADRLTEVLDRLALIEHRLDALERDSHPPAELTGPVYAAMARILRDAADIASAK